MAAPDEFPALVAASLHAGGARAGEATRGVQIMSDHEQTPLSDIPWSGLVNQAGVVGSTHGQQAIVESNRRVVP
jgi:hypothetical protein